MSIDGADRRIGGGRLAQRVDDEVAGRAAGEEDDDADEDEREADGAQGLATAIAGERDRGRVEQQDERGEHVADLLQEVEALLGGVELVDFMISIELASGGSLAATSGSPSCAVTDASTDVRSSVTTPPVVETNSPSSSIRAISLLCAAALASTKSCWTFGSLERLFDDVVGGAAKRSGDGAGERRGLRGKPIGELGLDVDVVEDRGDDEGVESRLDLGVLDQLLAGRAPGLGLEQLALGPEREHRDDRR